jgi:hypothetical protein
MTRHAVEYGGSNRLADYYRVSDVNPVTVRHGTASHPLCCLTCLKNACEHTEAAAAYIAAQHPTTEHDR